MFNKIGSVFLVGLFIYLVAMMVILGNGSSFMGRHLGFLFAPVANSVGLNTTWNFFSPDPAHTMYMKYIVHFEDEYGNPTEESIVNYFPEQKDNADFRLHVRRYSYVMRFLALTPERTGNFFIPWICKKYPKATRIQTEIEVSKIPALDVVATLKFSEYSDLVQIEQVNQYSYECPK